jgi:hypothetical protein
MIEERLRDLAPLAALGVLDGEEPAAGASAPTGPMVLPGSVSWPDPRPAAPR